MKSTTTLQTVLLQCASIAETIARRGWRDQMLDMIAGTRPFAMRDMELDRKAYRKLQIEDLATFRFYDPSLAARITEDA